MTEVFGFFGEIERERFFNYSYYCHHHYFVAVSPPTKEKKKRENKKMGKAAAPIHSVASHVKAKPTSQHQPAPRNITESDTALRLCLPKKSSLRQESQPPWKIEGGGGVKSLSFQPENV